MAELHVAAVMRFLRSVTTRLALTYLVLIMLMSIGFSFVFYNTSAGELSRQLPPNSFYSTAAPDDSRSGNGGQPHHDFDKFFQDRIDEGRHALLTRLITLNGLALVVGGLLSYALARRTLRPIEDAMDAQNQFVSDASHELRTPLTALQTTNEVALRKPKLTLTEARGLIQSNVEETIKLKALSDGLLGLLKQDKQPLARATVALPEVMQQALDQIVILAQAKKLTITDTVPRLTVLGNQQGLIQVLTILLDNAIKYSPRKGTIYIDAKAKGKYVYVTVRDEGAGITPEDLPHIFNRFYRADTARTNSSQHGYGLGLPIAKKIIEQHYGEIQVMATPKRGATFTVRLPLASKK